MKSEFKILDIRYKRKGELNPLVVEFQNGDIIDQKGPGLKAKLLPHEQLSDKMIEVTSPDGQKFVNNPISISPFTNRFIAVRNRRTNKVKLVEVEFTALINSVYVKEQEQEEKGDQKDAKQQIGTLKKMFGTKRAIRNWAQKETLDVDNSHVEDQISDMLTENTVTETTMNNTLLESSSVSLTPPCNRDAKSLADVYRIEDCLSNEEISSLTGAVTQILENRYNLKDASEYLKENLKEAMTTEGNKKARIACLLYADSLIGYLRVNAKALMKMMSNICPHSKLVRDKIIKQFCVKTGSSVNRPLTMKDKAVCHIIVLTLIACDYKVDLASLSKHSAYGFPKMKQLGRIVGVVPASKGSNKYILKLPLPAMPNLVKQTRKKK